MSSLKNERGGQRDGGVPLEGMRAAGKDGEGDDSEGEEGGERIFDLESRGTEFWVGG